MNSGSCSQMSSSWKWPIKWFNSLSRRFWHWPFKGILPANSKRLTSLRKQPTFLDVTTGFASKWRRHFAVKAFVASPNVGCYLRLKVDLKIHYMVIATWPGLLKKFRLILFIYNLITGCSQKNRENYPRKWYIEWNTSIIFREGQ